MKTHFIGLALIAILAFGAPTLATESTLAIAVTESTNGEYDDDINQAISAGATSTSMTVFWDEADKGGEYAPEFDWPSVANAYYPSKNMGLILSLPVIDTVADRRPKDLQNLDWDDPKVTRRFETYVTEILKRMRNTNLVAISIGNEIDGHLTRDQDWQDYQKFYIAAKDIVHKLRPEVVVGVTITWQGMQDQNAQRVTSLNAHSDAMFVNYYPLDNRFRVLPPADISAQLDAMIRAANGKPVYLLETGYPSGGCGSSEAMQLAYYQELLTAWEARKSAVPLITLVWLHDIAQSTVDHYARYYGVGNRCFVDYLATLGLRSQDGKNKPAFDWLINR